MQITTTNEAGASVIRVEGSMDAISVAEFDAEWKKVIEEGNTRVVVEMSGLEYISSAGLRGILMLAKTTKMKGVALAFAGMRDMVSDMFKLSGFLTILSVHPDVPSALAALK